jgi:NAD(P)-dependent dehydrogenase (short-subunit alcohol dehydrogenase family)
MGRDATARAGGCQNPDLACSIAVLPGKEVAMGRLDGRTAWVTGGGRGIGRAIGLAMAREGAAVAVSSRTRDELETVTVEIEAAGSRGLAVVADALDLAQTNAAARAILDAFGRLDILVNNAGGVVVGSAGFAGLQPIGHDDRLFLDNLSLNLVSAFRATNAVLAQMRDRRHGRIINIGSGYAKRSGGGLAYTSAKHGLIGYTRALAAQVAEHGITVNCLCPGWTNTRLVDWSVLGAMWGTDAPGAHAIAAREALQNRVLEPEELGPMAALLAADESAGITGQVISVDGGYKV